MKQKRMHEINRINSLTSEMESLYHQASLKLGISNSVSIILYTLYFTDGACLLSEIYKKSGISKQTVNSAIRNLEADGILYLELYDGKSKTVKLTEHGKAYAETTAARLCAAEIHAFDNWTEEDIDTYIRLMERYTECFRQQIDAWKRRA